MHDQPKPTLSTIMYILSIVICLGAVIAGFKAVEEVRYSSGMVKFIAFMVPIAIAAGLTLVLTWMSHIYEHVIRISNALVASKPTDPFISALLNKKTSE